MKHINFLFVALLILCSCHKEESFSTAYNNHYFSISTVAPDLEQSPMDETKVAVQPKFALKWSNGDSISVLNLSSGKTLQGNLYAVVDGDDVTFEGELSGSIKAGDKLVAVYPCQNYTSVVKVSDFSVDFATQECSEKDDIPFVAYSEFTCKQGGRVDVNAKFEVPISINQIALSNITPSTGIDYIELTNVGNGITFHPNTTDAKLEYTPSVGKVRIVPTAKSSRPDGSFFAYCGLAASPASDRSMTVKALPKIYYTEWAKSKMDEAKYYTSIASDFESSDYKDLMVLAPSSLQVEDAGGQLVFSITSFNKPWTAVSTPALDINPASGNTCENLEMTVTVPQNSGTAARKFQLKISGDGVEYSYLIEQKANPSKEIVEFPDIKLKQYMVSMFDDDGDGEISTLEAENVVNVNCSGKSISDLTGLELCPNLKYINFSGNSVSEVNLPNLASLETVIAYGCPISEINLNNDIALKSFYLQAVGTDAISGTAITIDGYDQENTLEIAFAGTSYTELNIINSSVLTSFDVKENVQLKKFSAFGNSLVQTADVSTLTALTDLDLHSCALTALNVDANTDLVNLDCSDNSISSLNLDNNIALEALNCSGNSLSSVKLLNNVSLQKIDVSSNALPNVNVRKNTLLKELNVSSNADITALDLSKNTVLDSLNASSTGLTDIDLTANTGIKSVDLHGCAGIHIIDLSVNTALVNLNVSNTSLSALDVSKSTSLSTLDVSNTSLSTLDVSKNTSLSTLDASNTSLSALDVSTNTSLYKLNVSNTSLSTLDVSKNTSLSTLNVSKTVKLVVSSGMKSSIYQVGQYVSIDNVPGVVFQTSMPQAVSLDENTYSHYGASMWCYNHGSGWDMPSKDQLVSIYEIKSDLNVILSSIGGTQLGNDTYWSSTSTGISPHYYVVNFSNGSVNYSDKNNSFQVRAVKAL